MKLPNTDARVSIFCFRSSERAAVFLGSTGPRLSNKSRSVRMPFIRTFIRSTRSCSLAAVWAAADARAALLA